MADRLVTVVVPHYDDLLNLDVCLAALERQTLPRDWFEIVVADNCSPQGRSRVEEVVGGRAEIITVEERGAGPARNAGAALAATPYLAFTDADCTPSEQWLENGLKALQKGSASADFIGGAMVVSTTDPERMTGAEALEKTLAFDNKRYVEKKGFTVTANLVVPRAIFERVGPFRNGLSEDVEWCHRAREMGYVIRYAPEAVVSHPARRNWSELKTKWERLNSEMAELTLQYRGGHLRWLLKTWLMPLSILPHALRIAIEPSVPGWRNKIRGIGMLARLRLWRFFAGHRVLWSSRSRRAMEQSC